MTQIPSFFNSEGGKYKTRLSKDSGEVKKKYVENKLTKVQNLNPVESLKKIFRKLLELSKMFIEYFELRISRSKTN